MVYTDKLNKTIEIINKKIVKDKYYNCLIRIEGFDEDNCKYISNTFKTKTELIEELKNTEYLDLIKYFKLNIIRDGFYINYSSSDDED